MGGRALRVVPVLAVVAVTVWWYMAGSVQEAAEDDPALAEPHVERDIGEIRKDTLRVLMLPDPFSYEMQRNGPTGVELEILQHFARHAGLIMKAVPVFHPDSALRMLQDGEGDVIAAGLARGGRMRHLVAFTKPHARSAPMLATLRPDAVAGVADAGQAWPDTMVISHWSPFTAGARRFNTMALRRSIIRDTTHLPEDLLAEVLLGRIPALVVPSHIAGHEARRFPPLQFDGPVGPRVPLAFALRRNAPELRKAINDWLDDPSGEAMRTKALEGFEGQMKPSGPLRSKRRPVMHRDSISPYDASFKAHAGNHGWPWELLAAMAWKESRFNHDVRSSKGAHGLMQLMPRTAVRMGLDSSGHSADEHIAAAMRYLGYLDTLWLRAVPERDQRLRFVLASYNSGPGHVVDAQRLAEQLGIDHQRWEGHVERAMLLLAKPRFHGRPGMKNGYANGRQTFHFVREVMAVYQHFRSARQPGKSTSNSSDASAAGA